MAALGGFSEVPRCPNSFESITKNRFAKPLARFAVEEHNKKQNTLLEFVRVVSATQLEVAAGTSYNIKLVADDGGKKQVYEARIWEELWLNFKELQEFNLVGDAPVESALYLNLIAFARLICPCLTFVFADESALRVAAER